MKIEQVISRDGERHKTICLSMIVKNEISILKRTFDSVWEYIDYWVICDTGSTDGTQQFIRDYFEDKGIEGELIEMEWVNFGYNRSELLKKSKDKEDYLLLMDADFVFKIKDKNFRTKMISDCYYIKYEGSLDYQQVLCVRSDFDWFYKGVTHEYITCDKQKFNVEKTDYFTFLHESDGFNRKDKVERDIRLLEQGLIDEPNNSRYHFYLAQSYMDGKNFEKSREHYTKRIEAGGWHEEIYYSKYQIAISYLAEIDKYDLALVLDKFLIAYNYRPHRLEALYFAIRLCREKGLHNMGFGIGIKAVNIEYPKDDVLFISIKIHRYEFLNELAICSFFSNKYEESHLINKKLLNEGRVPDEMRQHIQNNMNISLQKKQIMGVSGDPVIKERVDMLNKKLNIKEFEKIVVNTHLLNNYEKFDKGILIYTNDMDLFKLQQVFEKISKFALDDEKNIKRDDIVFVILENGVNSDVIDKYFSNLKYSIFRATIKKQYITYENNNDNSKNDDSKDDDSKDNKIDECEQIDMNVIGMLTISKMKCKQICIINDEFDGWNV